MSLSSGIAKADPPLVVSLPCSQAGLRDCSVVLNGGAGVNGQQSALGVANLQAVQGMISQLKSRTQNQIDGFYQGVDVDPLVGQTGKSGLQGSVFYPSPCDLGLTPFVQKGSAEYRELSNDHNGKSCGNAMQITLTNDGSSLGIHFHKNQNFGTQEDAYVNGGLVQAVSCFYAQVTNEILTKKQLTIKDIGGNRSACLALAKDLMSGLSNYSTKYTNSVQQTADNVTGQQNIGDILNCQNSFDPSNSVPGKAVDQGSLRQSAQQLCSGRMALESMFAQLAQCEIFARAQNAFLNQLGSQSAHMAILNMLMNRANPYCQKKCKGTFGDGGAMTSCGNACYQGYFPKLIQQYIENLWPSDTTTGQDCHAGAGIFPLLFLMGNLRGRRRRHRRNTRGNCLLRVTLALGVAAFVVGCGGASTVPSTTDMQASCLVAGISSPAGCCNSSGKPVNPLPNGCYSGVPLAGATSAALASGAAAAGASDAAIGNANRVLSSSTGNQTGGVAQYAATAGTGTTPVANGNVGTGMAQMNFPNAQSAKSALGGGGMSSGNSGSGFGNSTLTAPPAAPTEVQRRQGAGSETGAYAGGGGGGGAHGAGDLGVGNLFDRFSGNAGAGASPTEGDATFGRRNETSALGTEDPANYFARLGPGDSIFKVIERKYQEKSLHWASEDAASGTNPAVHRNQFW